MQLPYIVFMEGCEAQPHGRFQFGADADAFAKKKSRQGEAAGAIAWVVHDERFTSDFLDSRFQGGRRCK